MENAGTAKQELTPREKHLIQKVRDAARLKELTAQIRKNRRFPLPLPGDAHSALNMLTRELRTERFKRQAINDVLTGLHSRRYFDQEFPQELARAKRAKEPIALVLGDLRGLKIINDTHGHQAGDVVLHHVGAALKEAARGADVLCRTGGDEVGIIVTDLVAESGPGRFILAQSAARAALRLLQSVQSKDVQYHEKSLGRAHLDLGVFIAKGDENPNEVYGYADEASYIAKKIIPAGELSLVVATKEDRGVDFQLFTLQTDGKSLTRSPIPNAAKILAAQRAEASLAKSR